MEAHDAESQSDNCFVCNEPGHRKRDCPVFKASSIGKGKLRMSTKPSMAEKGLEAAVGDRSVEDRHNRLAMVGLVVELMVRVEVATRGEAMLTESAPYHYGPTQPVAQAHAVSVSCIRCQQKGHLVTIYPLRVKQEQAYNTDVIDKTKIVWSHDGEFNEEYSCVVCDVQGVVRNTIIFNSGCSRHMFPTGACFKILARISISWSSVRMDH